MKSLLKKSALCSASCLQAMTLVGAGAVGAMALSAPAYAQDYTAGAITGTVTDESGKPVEGATVTLESKNLGFSRTATTSASGTFRFGGIAGGNYDLTVKANGMADYRATDVNVLASQTASLGISMSSSQEIVVVGSAIVQAFSGTTSGVNVDVEDLVKRAPLGRSLTSVVLLAPGTSQGDSAFGDLASIGGSSVAENAYYINGLNITNFDNYLGSAQVPFDFYKSVEVKSGGYPAEYGRATGGIVNAVTKSGSNDFMAAIHLNWAPDWARSDGKNLQYCDNNGCYDSTDRKNDKADSFSAIVEASGPIIKDRLFIYGMLEMRRNTSTTFDVPGATAYERTNDNPFWGVKVDAYPLDDHHLEFTIFDTRNTTRRNDVPFGYDSNGVPNLGIASSVTDFNYGGVNFVGKYTGRFTDFLTVSLAYGRMKDRFDNQAVAGDAGLPYFRNLSGQTVLGVPYGGYYNGQRVASTSYPHATERKFWRGDVDLFFSAFGEHHVRAGFDVENNTLVESTVRTGSSFLCSVGFLTQQACDANNGGAGVYFALRSVGGSSGTFPLVEVNYYNSGGSFKARNQAFYIEDEWQVTDRLTLNLGLRRDDFAVDKADGNTLANLKDNYGLRLGGTYDMWSDHSGKFKVFFGQYYLPIASNTAYRQAGAEYYFRERYNFEGIDNNGLPILGDQVTDYPGYGSSCPFLLTPNSSGSYCSTTGDGSVPDTGAAIAHNLKATKETEWIIGYEHKLGDWSFGLTYTHRNLDITAEDMAIDKAVIAYCAANNIAGCSSTWTGYNQYVITNPGQDVVVNLAGLDGRTVTFTAAELGYPKAKRTYDAVEFTFERAFDGKWGLKGSYTWSKSLGNSEGFVQSDFGQDDAGITQDFDQPGFTEYAYGYLPNDRRHRFKLWGTYAITDAFLIGMTASVQSPRHLSCFGYYPVANSFENGYGAASHYCGGKPSPRGTAQQSDWVSQFDLSARYNLSIPTGQKVTLRVDIFNIFNSQAVEKRNEIGEIGYLDPNPSYHLPTQYQTPRYVRFGMDINF